MKKLHVTIQWYNSMAVVLVVKSQLLLNPASKVNKDFCFPHSKVFAGIYHIIKPSNLAQD